MRSVGLWRRSRCHRRLASFWCRSRVPTYLLRKSIASVDARRRLTMTALHGAWARRGGTRHVRLTLRRSSPREPDGHAEADHNQQEGSLNNYERPLRNRTRTPVRWPA
jgi:hypothetical protein